MVLVDMARARLSYLYAHHKTTSTSMTSSIDDRDILEATDGRGRPKPQSTARRNFSLKSSLPTWAGVSIFGYLQSPLNIVGEYDRFLKAKMLDVFIGPCYGTVYGTSILADTR